VALQALKNGRNFFDAWRRAWPSAVFVLSFLPC
jgi:hypothetical protein